MGYRAEGDKIYVEQKDVGDELFLTVHPTDTGGTQTVEQQAATLARILNEL
jgi:hypothetical protein